MSFPIAPCLKSNTLNTERSPARNRSQGLQPWKDGLRVTASSVRSRRCLPLIEVHRECVGGSCREAIWETFSPSEFVESYAQPAPACLRLNRQMAGYATFDCCGAGGSSSLVAPTRGAERRGKQSGLGTYKSSRITENGVGECLSFVFFSFMGLTTATAASASSAIFPGRHRSLRQSLPRGHPL